jgi:P27 family predicted phage terminase small subunit
VKRGRKSAADLTVVRATDARVVPPEHLTPAQLAEWLAIVNSLPADYFRPGDVPLLAAFCAASALYKEALALIQAEGVVMQPVEYRAFNEDGSTKSEKFGRPIAHPAAPILTSQSSAMAQLATKLRLCPSARYTEKAAATKSNGARGARPWEDAASADGVGVV